jgi:hypothetical protein
MVHYEFYKNFRVRPHQFYKTLPETEICKSVINLIQKTDKDITRVKKQNKTKKPFIPVYIINKDSNILRKN